MLKDTSAFSGFSVNNIAAAKKFYGEILGLEVTEDKMGLTLKLANGTRIFVYAKPNHEPATFTILNFEVKDIDETVAELEAKSVVIERIEGLPAQQDEKGILRGRASGYGPDIAWFKDPAGNTLSVLQN
jgi:catechol 2,3-dioxygenase-like lactoylglutathione lyase family enzyme